MQQFTVNLKRSVGFHAGGMTPQPDVALKPVSWSANQQGPLMATVEATGSEEALGALLWWLGDGVEISNSYGTQCWWGIIDEVEANLGRLRISMALDGTYNRIKILYRTVGADGSLTSQESNWYVDQISIDRYGRRDLLHSVEEGIEDESAAGILANSLLQRLSSPTPTITTGGDPGTHNVTLHCRGKWALLEAVYYSQLTGLTAYEEGTNSPRYLGATYTSSGVAFGPSADPGGGADDIFDTNDGLGVLTRGVTLTISGAAVGSNNGVWTVKSVEGNSHIEVEGSGEIADEAAGATVVFSIGETGPVDRIAQAFMITTTTSYNAGEVALKLQRFGNPADNLRLALCANSVGLPSSELDSVEIAASSVLSEAEWITFRLSNTVILYPATTYWLKLERTGANSLLNYVAVFMDEIDDGEVGYVDQEYRFDTGNGTWLYESSDLNFRVQGFQYTTSRAREALEATTIFTDVQIPTASLVSTYVYQPEERTVAEIVEEVLARGTSAGGRLVARVYPDNTLWIVARAVSDDNNPVMGRDGKLRWGGAGAGALFEPGVLVAGRYVQFEGLPALDGLNQIGVEAGAAYVVECEYSADDDSVILRTEGTPDPFDLLGLGN